MIAIATPSTHEAARIRSRASRRLLTLFSIPLICLAFSWIGVRASGAYFTARDMRIANDQLERKYLKMRQQNERMESEVKAFQTNAGISRAARRLGWVKQGEVHLKMPENP